jgi:hypothetical protein
MDLSLFQSILVSHAHETEVLYPRGARHAWGYGAVAERSTAGGVVQDVKRVKLQASFKVFCLVEVVPILYPRNLNKA